MNTILPINEQQLVPSFDTNLLRTEARRLIEEVASGPWADYNTHDPGITILELLVYGLSDLGLRSQLKIEEYLAGSTESLFFTAREALPNAAWTVKDLRRLLIDRTDIRDAAIRPFPRTVPGRVKGLYELLLDLAPISFSNGTLSEPFFELVAVWLRGTLPSVPVNGQEADFTFYVVFPYWEELPAVWGSDEELSAVQLDSPNQIIIVEPDRGENLITQILIEPLFTFENNAPESLQLRIRLPVGIPDAVNQDDLTQIIQNQINEKVDFFRTHQFRVRERAKRLDAPKEFIRQHRNLCEDWQEVNTIRIQQIGLRIDELELQPAADPEAVIARIYFLIGQFIDPDFQSSTFAERLEAGQTPPDIFAGPLLENGFIPAGRLDRMGREDKIYTSDLVRIIMQQSEVIGVRDLTLDHFFDRIKAATGVVNCLQLRNPGEYKPRFSFYDSEVRVVKGALSIPVNQDNIKKSWEALKTNFRSGLTTDGSGDLPIPQGEPLDIETFYSIQHDFPNTYGLKEGGIVNTAPPLRKAQAKQLKAYLLFFEQLLANYASQLAHLPELFSMSKSVERTYFFQDLYQVPAVRELFLDFLGQRGRPALESWEAFQSFSNSYIQALSTGGEDQPAFRKRRYQFIQHLLARQGEDNTDYENWTLARNGGQIGADLLIDQVEFLQEVPTLSSQRGKAFNYGAKRTEDPTEIDVWDTNNVSGLEKRVAQRLGIPNPNRRNLATQFDPQSFIETTTVPGTSNPQFNLWNAPFETVRLAPDQYRVLLTWEDPAATESILQYGRQTRYYQVTPMEETRQSVMAYQIDLYGPFPREEELEPLPIARHPFTVNNRGDAEAIIRDIIHTLQGRLQEGMHLIEHVLLRPIGPVESSLETIVQYRIEDEEEPQSLSFVQDPYSFQVSIFLPGWTPRLADREFRALVERTIREEMPTHILPWIYWVNLVPPQANGADIATTEWGLPQAFVGFETAYQRWLENLSDYLTTNSSESTAARDDLVNAINNLIALLNEPLFEGSFRTVVELTNQYQPFSLDQ